MNLTHATLVTWHIMQHSACATHMHLSFWNYHKQDQWPWNVRKFCFSTTGRGEVEVFQRCCALPTFKQLCTSCSKWTVVAWGEADMFQTSVNLTSPDFSFWGYTKTAVCGNTGFYSAETFKTQDYSTYWHHNTTNIFAISVLWHDT